MITSVVATAVVTVIIMFLLHQTYIHLQSTLTVPKVADLVQRPAQKYSEIEKILNPAPPKKMELKQFLGALTQKRVGSEAALG